jgi:hypothetical protein
MNEKLKRLAIKMEGLFPNPKSPKHMYLEFSRIAIKQQDYFKELKAENAIKLMFYIYSLKKTGNFELGEKILNNLFFAHFLISSGEYAEKSCGVCGAYGTVDCENCDNGIKVCEDCDGSGEVEHGGEDVACETCDGDGEFNCEDCEGKGTLECPACEGTGEFTSETDIYYEVLFVCSWNKELYEECYAFEDEERPITDGIELIQDDDTIILTSTSDEGPIKDTLKPDKLYCINLSDKPEIRFTNNDMKIMASFPLRYFLQGWM